MLRPRMLLPNPFITKLFVDPTSRRSRTTQRRLFAMVKTTTLGGTAKDVVVGKVAVCVLQCSPVFMLTKQFPIQHGLMTMT